MCQDDAVLMLGPRRIPPVMCGIPNEPDSIKVLTSVGFRQLDISQYTESIQKLQPDIAVGLADIVNDGQKPGSKRREKMVDRTHAWTRDIVENLEESRSLYLAPVLPLDFEQQHLYLQELEEEMKDHIAGFAVYDSSGLTILPESMSDLIRVSFSEPRTPHQVLKDIFLGADMMTISFVNSVSDAGIALDFGFSPSGATDQPPQLKPLGFDMWSSMFKTDTSSLIHDCHCFTCRNHHRAYIHHLLNAKEMLAWTLLQLHNHNVMDVFITSIRESIIKGTFSEGMRNFEITYETEFPEQTGPGPKYVPTSCPLILRESFR